MTPAGVHDGRAQARHPDRAHALSAAYAATPQRFARRRALLLINHRDDLEPPGRPVARRCFARSRHSPGRGSPHKRIPYASSRHPTGNLDYSL
jgi:hypothetical protein